MTHLFQPFQTNRIEIDQSQQYQEEHRKQEARNTTAIQKGKGDIGVQVCNTPVPSVRSDSVKLDNLKNTATEPCAITKSTYQ